jgi:hypothetical protein
LLSADRRLLFVIARRPHRAPALLRCGRVRRSTRRRTDRPPRRHVARSYGDRGGGP